MYIVNIDVNDGTAETSCTPTRNLLQTFGRLPDKRPIKLYFQHYYSRIPARNLPQQVPGEFVVSSVVISLEIRIEIKNLFQK